MQSPFGGRAEVQVIRTVHRSTAVNVEKLNWAMWRHLRILRPRIRDRARPVVALKQRVA